jgi:hypothetical protein
LTDVSEVLAASIIKGIIALTMEAVSTSETSVNQTKRRSIPENSHLTGSRENLKLAKEINFLAVKVPRQYPFVLLVKEDFRESKAFGSGESTRMRKYCFRS